MRFWGAGAGLLIGLVLGIVVARLVVRYWSVTPEPLEASLLSFGCIVACGVVGGWIVGGVVQDRDGEGLRSYRRPKR